MEEILEIKDHLMNEEFDSLENSQKRVDYVFEKIGSIDYIRENVKEFLSDYKKDYSKSSERSQSYREKGNYYFCHKNMEYALYYYTLVRFTKIHFNSVCFNQFFNL